MHSLNKEIKSVIQDREINEILINTLYTAKVSNLTSCKTVIRNVPQHQEVPLVKLTGMSSFSLHLLF